MSADCSPSLTPHGFTIVELLVVIVVIGILAAITIVSYSGITTKASLSAIQSDLTNAATQLKSYSTLYGSFPTSLDGSNCPTAPTTDTNYCLKSSNGSSLSYSHIAGKTFHLTATNGNTSYSITDSTAPAIATTANGSSVGSACPTGYIPVPGSGTYGTSDFCVMKYEAKILGDNNGDQAYNPSFVPDSRPDAKPWARISQNDALAEAATACTGCHLITEAEWMTIAQNVLSVASNWSGGSVGSGYIYSGHNDNDQAYSLFANSDSSGYYGTNNTAPSNQRRTLALTNGQVIWDLSGSVWEWTSGQTTGGQPGIVGGGYSSRQWTAPTTAGSLSPSPFPGATGIAGSSSWTSAQGIGTVYSSADETGTRVFVRGGNWNYGGAGVLALSLSNTAGATDASIGFRVSR